MPALPQDPYRAALISVLTENEPGVLARVAGLFTGRGYNIDSLTVAAVDERLARFTITTRGTETVIEQVKAQLDRLIPVHRVTELSAARAYIAREMALVKIACSGKRQLEALKLATSFDVSVGAHTLEATDDCLILEITGGAGQIDDFLGSMQSVDIIEVIRTGITAIACGSKPT